MPTTVARSITRSETGRPRDFLDQRPEDVAAVERQDRQQVDEAEREADEGEQEQRPFEALFDHLVADIADPDDAGDLLALFLFEEMGEDVDGPASPLPRSRRRLPSQRYRRRSAWLTLP